MVYTGEFHNRKVAIKVKNPKSEAKESIKNITDNVKNFEFDLKQEQ